MKDWKIIAISATLAFLFSFIPGLIGSVSTGVLLFRAFMGAIVFGLMGFGFSVLLRRYLPELFEFRSSSSRLENDSEIVLESDDSSIGQSTIDISIDDETENTLLNSDSEEKGAQIDEESKKTGDDLIDEIVETGKPDESDLNNGVPGNIDVLPDMGVFSNSFENTDDAGDNGSGGTGTVSVDIMGEEQSPELVARAVQTMVKKDQEG
ncbi:MAG: hypothetical protein PF693_21265 [Spirochaetia bacterium]|jgi:hypothetical protein|nr:hypothetical protein [Spirochaetia bacterium]